MTPFEQAANDLAKAYWLMQRAWFVRGFDEDESLQECEHLTAIANEAAARIKAHLLELYPLQPGAGV